MLPPASPEPSLYLPPSSLFSSSSFFFLYSHSIHQLELHLITASQHCISPYHYTVPCLPSTPPTHPSIDCPQISPLPPLHLSATMHAYTIAASLAMAGSAMAAVIQSPPPASTTTTTTEEIRPYGPTCAGFGPNVHGPTCAGVGPDAPTPPTRQGVQELKNSLTEEERRVLDVAMDMNNDGRFDEKDMAALEEMYGGPGLPNLPEDDDDFEDDEPPTVDDTPPMRPASPIVHTATPIRLASPVVHTAPPVHLASPVVRVASPSCPEATCPAGTRYHANCTDPQVHNSNWNKLALLNDTRKNINGFKLFAEVGNEMPMRFALHAREHENRKDIWNVKMVPANDSFTPESVRKELASMNLHQPRWNLADNRLETRSNESTPVDDTLYLRLYDAKVKKDTTELKGPVLRSVLTTNANKNKYGKEGNAKLLAKESWQLRRDTKAPYEYTLLNKDVKGGFFWCMDDKQKMDVLADVLTGMAQEEPDMSNLSNLPNLISGNGGAELVYVDSENNDMFTFINNRITEHCIPVTLKVR